MSVGLWLGVDYLDIIYDLLKIYKTENMNDIADFYIKFTLLISPKRDCKINIFHHKLLNISNLLFVSTRFLSQETITFPVQKEVFNYKIDFNIHVWKCNIYKSKKCLYWNEILRSLFYFWMMLLQRGFDKSHNLCTNHYGVLRGLGTCSFQDFFFFIARTIYCCHYRLDNPFQKLPPFLCHENYRDVEISEMKTIWRKTENCEALGEVPYHQTNLHQIMVGGGSYKKVLKL